MEHPAPRLAFISKPAPDVCLLNLQVAPDSEHIRVALTEGQRYGMLVKLAEASGSKT